MPQSLSINAPEFTSHHETTVGSWDLCVYTKWIHNLYQLLPVFIMSSFVLMWKRNAYILPASTCNVHEYNVIQGGTQGPVQHELSEKSSQSHLSLLYRQCLVIYPKWLPFQIDGTLLTVKCQYFAIISGTLKCYINVHVWSQSFPPSLHLITGNNISGIASTNAIQNGQIATRVEICI